MPDQVTAINSKTLIRNEPAPMPEGRQAPARAVPEGRPFLQTMAGLALMFIIACAALVATLPARADELADVTRLYKAGSLEDASKQADAFLSTNPRDPRMRFIKGVILMDQKRPADAQVVFERLTQDYPELPEPYNNLAVIYAGEGDYARARVALEMVVRVNPGYAVAYENLGDVHLKLASQAYGNAQRLDQANTSLGPKLNAIRELLGPVPSGPRTAPQP